MAKPKAALNAARRESDRLHRDHSANSDVKSAARQQVRDAERSYAASTGAPYAVPFEFELPWDTGAPLPIVVSGKRTFLAYYLPTHFDFDGTNPRSRTADQRDAIGLVEFVGAASTKIGSPGDETLQGHPLYHSGLTFYGAHIVENSPWIEELEEIARSHSNHNPARERTIKHYLFAFHDETFECVARGYEATRREATLLEIAAEVALLAAS